MAKINLDSLRDGLKGRVLTAADGDYDALRTVVYGGIDKRPAAIVLARNSGDVQRAVNFARDNGIELAVRSGGHSGVGYGATEGGLVIDLRQMKGLEINPATRLAWAEPGLTAEEFTKAAEKHGLAVGFGDAGSVGLGGIATGGGVGYLTRKFGMTVDAMRAAEIVTADGRLMTASADEHPDLFWAIRGGGGNFGVVTRFRFELEKLPEFTGGMLVLPATAETVTGFMAASEAAPEALGGIANVMPAPPMPFLAPEWHGKLIIMAMLGYAGSPKEADAALKPLRALATPLADMVKPQPYSAMYPPEDPDYHPTAVSKTMLIDRVDAAVGETIMGFLNASDAGMRVAQLRVLGGAAARVPDEATAYAHRQAPIMVNVACFYQGEADKQKRQRWVDDFVAALDQGRPGGYVNFVNDEGPAAVKFAYPDATYRRLQKIKAKYDPGNLFQLNHNIVPAA